MNFNFTDEIIEIAKSKVPNNIKEKYIKESDVSFKYGYTRFENDDLKAIYFYPNGFEIPNCYCPPVFKFDVIDGDLVFKYVYDFLKENNDDSFVEARYDADMNLDCTYNHFNEKVFVKNGYIFSSKEKDNVKTNYVFYNDKDNFYGYSKYLKDNKIINIDSSDLFHYGKKENTDVIYLVIA